MIKCIRFSAVLVCVLLATLAGRSWAIPGYHVNDDPSAKRATHEFADNCASFRACIYQAELDKSTWRLTLAAHDYLLEKPGSPERECSFSTSYWHANRPGTNETITPAAQKQIQAMFQEAVACTKDAAKKLPKSAPAHVNYGYYQLYFEVGMQKVPTMLFEFKKAVALQPEIGEYHYWLAEGYGSSGNSSRATLDNVITEGKAALKLDPRQAGAWFLMSVASMQPTKADYKNAKLYLDEYLKLCPQGNPGVPGMQKFLKEKLGK